MSHTLGPIFNAQHGKTREWSVTISLFDKNGKIKSIGDIDSTKVGEGYYAQYSTLSGYTGMKMTQSSPTTISIGKNLGRKNETNALTQAYKECKSKYASKLKAGYTETVQSTVAKNTMPFPMAVKSWKNFKDRLQYPLFIQPKLDGVRLLARFKDGAVQLYTRRLHTVAGFENIKRDLDLMFKSTHLTSYIVDGELYAHGMNLQTISGIVRNESISEEMKSQLQYHVFDFFDIGQEDLSFSNRHVSLTKFVESVESTNVILNPTSFAETSEDADLLYKNYTKQGYEGVIYKSDKKPYEFDFNKEKRSGWYLKRKKQDDAEFPIVAFSHGKGKDVDCIVFTLQGPNGKTFNCVPNGTYDYRKELYAQAVASFDELFLGKLAKVIFDDLSKDKVPLRGRIVQIGRDLSFD